MDYNERQELAVGLTVYRSSFMEILGDLYGVLLLILAIVGLFTINQN